MTDLTKVRSEMIAEATAAQARAADAHERAVLREKQARAQAVAALSGSYQDQRYASHNLTCRQRDANATRSTLERAQINLSALSVQSGSSNHRR
ncbi:MAG TPA: hypothetical protein V6C81_07810 [Planktothrix sp.]|jgi:hypothetical protein